MEPKQLKNNRISFNNNNNNLHILNFLLFIFSILCAFVIEESNEYNFRIIVYYLLLFLCIILLIFLNFKENINNIFNNLIKYFQTKKPKIEKNNEVKDLIKQELNKNNNNQGNFLINNLNQNFYNYYNNNNEQNDNYQTLLNSNNRLNQSFFQNNLNKISPNKNFNINNNQNNPPYFNQNINYYLDSLNQNLNNNIKNNNNVYFDEFSSYSNNIYNNINNNYNLFNNVNNYNNQNNLSLLIYKKLKNQIQVLKQLDRNNVDLSNINDIPHELESINFNVWIKNFKNFIIKYELETICNEHFNNLINLNKLVQHIEIEIISNQSENNNINIMQFLEKNLHENSFHLDKLMNFDLINKSSNKNRFIFKIFFGNSNKLKEIIKFIDNKLQHIKNKNFILFQRNENNNDINKIFMNNDEYLTSYLNKLNPFSNFNQKNSNIKFFVKNVNNNNFYENLINLKKLLIERIALNECIFPKKFIKKIISENHANIIIEYIMERLNELKKNFDIYSNNSGGKFYNEEWTNLFPTDSQIISNLNIFFLEQSYNNLKKYRIFLNSPVPPTFEDNNDNIYLYQANTNEFEPYFCIIYKKIIIPCDNKENFFFTFIVYLYLLRQKNQNMLRNLGLLEVSLKILNDDNNINYNNNYISNNIFNYP